MRNIMFTTTTENLRTIIAGMEPTEDDSILAIAGSGDQAFALLEYAGKVTAVDINSDQMWYVRKRIDALKKGHYREFLESPINDVTEFLERSSRNIYFRGFFRTNRRLERIRKRLDRLEIVEGDIFQIIKKQKGNFNKVYFSNLGDWVAREQLYESDGLDHLPNGCLVYCSSGPPVESDHLVVDERLTSQSRRFGKYWRPTVYRKVSPPIQFSPVAPVRYVA